MDAKEQKAVIESYISAYNNFDVEGMLALVHPNVVFKNVAGGEVNATALGASELREMANQTKALFSARRLVMTGFKSAGDTATVDIVYEGVLAVDLPNGRKAGEVLRLKGRSEFDFRDSKLYRITDYS
jgi:ketosteroid isomerase-like protein